MIEYSNGPKDKVLTITRADKGNTTYKKLDFNPTDKYVKFIRKELESLKNNLHITPQIYNKFYPRGCSAPKIYGLPEIHKMGVPLRPIESTFSSSVAKLGKWLLVALRQLLGTQKSYLKNSTDLTNKLGKFHIGGWTQLLIWTMGASLSSLLANSLHGLY